MTTLKGISKRVLLIICDGMGLSDNRNKNAVFDANTPTLDRLLNEAPYTTLSPGGELVGLPKGVAGNSEVGHMNLGAGQSVRQDLVRINEAIQNNTLKDMPKLQELIQKSLNGSKRLHLMTLLSDGGVHSHINHLKAVLKILEQYDLEVFFHAFMDGRDTPFNSGLKYIKEIEKEANFKFASIQGRSIGMDRDRRWEKIENAYSMMTGKGSTTELSPSDYTQQQYDQEIYDEFLTPILFNKDYAITSDDTLFFLNFRPDRAKQISEVFCSDKFEYFKNDTRPEFFLCMSPYIDEEFPEVPILFNREKVKGTLCEFLSNENKKVLKIAETEKYAHVTYFFNGGEETPFNGEERILVDSPKDVATYDLKPQMSAPIVLDKLLEKMKDDSFSLYVVNFANPDMVGHTGKYEAAVKAMEEIDRCLLELTELAKKEEISVLITADHGNCDQMVYDDGSPHTSHSNANVPFILIDQKISKDSVTIKSTDNALRDVAPTILHLLGFEKPDIMSGNTIFS